MSIETYYLGVCPIWVEDEETAKEAAEWVEEKAREALGLKD